MMLNGIFEIIFKAVGWKEKRDKYFEKYPGCSLCNRECTMFWDGKPYCMECAEREGIFP